VQYTVKVNLGPADICFELWHQGVKLSKDEAIKVEWAAAPPPDPQSSYVQEDLPVSSLAAAMGTIPRKSMLEIQRLSPRFGAGTVDSNGYSKDIW
jgi:hypothetical protein